MRAFVLYWGKKHPSSWHRESSVLGGDGILVQLHQPNTHTSAKFCSVLTKTIKTLDWFLSRKHIHDFFHP